jgi:kinesin family protein 16B
MNFKVAVRIRPFNKREISLDSKLCVDMVGNTTRLIDPDNLDKHKDFTYDYSFWSYD